MRKLGACDVGVGERFLSVGEFTRLLSGELTWLLTAFLIAF